MEQFRLFLRLLQKLATFLLDVTTYLVSVFFLIVACVLPWRAVHILLYFTERCDKMGFRAAAVLELGFTILDAISAPLGVAGALVPTRTYYYIDGFRKTLKENANNDSKYNGHLREHWMGTFGAGLVDVVCFVIAAPFLVIPSRAFAVGRITLQHRAAFTYSTDLDGIDPRVVWVASPFIGLAEIGSALLGLLALLSGVRSYQTMQDVSEVLAKETTRYEDDFFFRVGLHRVLVTSGLTLVVDMFFLPLLALLVPGFWRLSPVLQELRRGFDWTTRGVVLKQFGRLVVDVLLLPLSLLVALSWYRSHEVRTTLGTGSETSSSTESRFLVPYHVAVLRAAGLLLLDVLCLPFLMILALVTFYRLPALMGDLAGVAFHRAVLREFKGLILDVPCLLAGLVLICTLYRADLALRLCKRDALPAGERRRAVLQQLLRLVRDASMFPLALLVVVTLYRLPALLLGLKARLARMLAEDPEMRVLEAQVVTPKPKGRIGFTIRAAKSPNLAGVTSMRLQLAGDGFWASVAAWKGPMVASAGRALLPLALRDGREVDFSAVAHGRNEAVIRFELERVVKFNTIQKALRSLPGDAEMLVQLEATIGGSRQAVLIALPLMVQDLANAIESDGDLLLPPERNDHDTAEHFANLRGSAAGGLRRDAWWPAVVAEFVTVVTDLFHVLLAALLVAVPWRFLLALLEILERDHRRAAGQAWRTYLAMEQWERACDKASARLETLLNSYAKAFASHVSLPGVARGGSDRDRDGRDGCTGCMESFIGELCCIFCPCCLNYEGFDSEDMTLERRRPARRNARSATGQLEARLVQLTKPLKRASSTLKSARKSWPKDEQWAPLEELLDSRLRSRCECFFWMFVFPELHLLHTCRKITAEEHARVVQKVRQLAESSVRKQKEDCANMHDAIRKKCDEMRARGGSRVKTKSECWKIFRMHFVKAFGDLFALPLLIVLLVTVYRIPRLQEDLKGAVDAQDAKFAIRAQMVGLVNDVSTLLQLLLLTAVLVATVVKLPDFLTHLRPSCGLRANRDVAISMVAELIVGIGELLLLLTAWKTYRLAVFASVFGACSPAAMLAVALPQTCNPRLRFSATCLGWFGVVAVAVFGPAIAAQLAAAGLLLLAFVGLVANGTAGWAKPRGGTDWWSSAARCTVPNAMALTAAISEAVVLAWAGSCSTSGGMECSLGLTTNPVEAATIAALAVVVLAILLSTVPIVADEADQHDIVTEFGWRGAGSMLQEVLFAPTVLVLSATASSWWPSSVALFYYIAISVLTNVAWDVPLPRQAMLDIRCVELCSAGRRLMLAGAVLSAIHGNHIAFVAVAATSAVWSVGWTFRSAVPWAQLFHVGASAGAVALAFGGLLWGLVAWGSTLVLAVVVALSARVLRRRRWAASGVPVAMERISKIQERLSLWGQGGQSAAALRAQEHWAQGAAQKLLDLEEGIPFEHLRSDFTAHRPSWRRRLEEAPDYDTILELLEKLESAIDVPCTRMLMRQVLQRVPVKAARAFPACLAKEVVSFAVPSLDFTPPEPNTGWHVGKLNLVELRRAAVVAANAVPDLIDSKLATRSSASRPKPKRRMKAPQRNRMDGRAENTTVACVQPSTGNLTVEVAAAVALPTTAPQVIGVQNGVMSI